MVGTRRHVEDGRTEQRTLERAIDHREVCALEPDLAQQRESSLRHVRHAAHRIVGGEERACERVVLHQPAAHPQCQRDDLFARGGIRRERCGELVAELAVEELVDELPKVGEVAVDGRVGQAEPLAEAMQRQRLTLVEQLEGGVEVAVARAR